jgi:hypothetical protein
VLLQKTLPHKIETAWAEFHASARRIESYDSSNYNTGFLYKLVVNRKKTLQNWHTEFVKYTPICSCNAKRNTEN